MFWLFAEKKTQENNECLKKIKGQPADPGWTEKNALQNVSVQSDWKIPVY